MIVSGLLVVAVFGTIVGRQGASSGTASAPSDWPAPIHDDTPLAGGALVRISGVVNRHVELPNGAGTMRFESGGRTIEAAIKANRFVVDLPAGTWTQRSLDGRICDQPVVVDGGPSYSTGRQYEGRFAGCTPISANP